MEVQNPAVLSGIVCRLPRDAIYNVRLTCKQWGAASDHEYVREALLNQHPHLRKQLKPDENRTIDVLRCWRHYESIVDIQNIKLLNCSPEFQTPSSRLWDQAGHRSAEICDGYTLQVSQLDSNGKYLPVQTTDIFLSAYCSLKVEAVWFTDSSLRIKLANGPILEANMARPNPESLQSNKYPRKSSL